MGTDPAEWLRSHSASAPTSCVSHVNSAMSAHAPDRYATCDKQTRATSAASPHRKAAPSESPSGPSMGSHSNCRSSKPLCCASPSSTYRSVGKFDVSVTMTAPVRPGVQRGDGELVQVDRRRVPDHDLARLGAQQRRRQPVAEAHRHVDPVGPRPDQAPPPLLRHHPLDAAEGGVRQPPQRVAVHVDEAVVSDGELVAERRQRVGRVHGQSRRAVGHSRATTAAHDADVGSIGSKWPSPGTTTNSTSSPA